MKLDEVKEIINMINDSELSYFEVNIDNKYIKMDKSMSRSYGSLNQNYSNISEIIEEKSLDTNLNNNIEAAIDKDINEEIEDFEFIKSPMVGTFYKAISPDESPFVSVNQKISKGDIVCIVEAMKLMNEISSDCDCEIIDVLVENGVMVEYGEPLFKIRRK